MIYNICATDPTYADQLWYIRYATYNVAAPLYFVLALSGQVILIFTFVKEVKSQKGYMYQVYCTSAKAAETVFRSLLYFSVHMIAYSTGRAISPIQATLVRCYPCAWYAAHMAAPLSMAWTIAALLLSMAMAADRVFSLLSPTKYNMLPHGRNRRIVLGTCVLIGYGATAFDILRMDAKLTPKGEYTFPTNTAYMEQSLIKALAFIRAAIQGAGVIALVSLSAMVYYLYRTRFVAAKLKLFTKSEHVKYYKQKEKTLLQLTLVECSLTIVNMSVAIIFITMTYANPEFYECWRVFMNPAQDLSRMIIDMTNFYIIMVVCKDFRQTVKVSLRSSFIRNQVANSA